MQDIPEPYYRISTKALILNDEKKFLLFCEDNGTWELPGGGIDWGESPQDCLKREILEEAGLTVLTVSENPSYFITAQSTKRGWVANVIYTVTVENVDFTPSDECVAVKYFSVEEALQVPIFPTMQQFAQLFNPDNH